MKRLILSVLVAALFLALLSGCPNAPRPTGTAARADTAPTANPEMSETSPPADTVKTAAVVPVPPQPEPPPKSKALPRMWDYGSEKCIPCQEMSRIITPMMAEYAGRIDIRIINVYEEKELAQQARIQVIPTQVFYDPDGNEVFRHVGVIQRDAIVAKFKELGWE